MVVPTTSEQTIVLKVLKGSAVSKTYVLEAVGDIEVTDSVELATEPGVMGRIGPKFPRTASFRVRVRDNDPRTLQHKKARDQHTLLRSLIGQLLYIDARASPPEKITWTLENVKASDDNSTKNAYDVVVSAREIIGGDFGDFIDPSELTTSVDLVPVEVTDPTILGAGNQTLTIDLQEADLRGKNDFYPAQAAGKELFVFNGLGDLTNFNAVAAVSSPDAAKRVLYNVRDSLRFNPNHIRIFGGRLPETVGCTLITMEFRVLDKDYTVTVDATTILQALTLEGAGYKVSMVPNSTYFLTGVAKEVSLDPHNRRTDILFPSNLDVIVAFAPDKRDGVAFTTQNFPRYSLILIFIGGLSA